MDMPKQQAPGTAPSAAHRALRERAQKVLDILEEMYPDARCSLHFADPFQLLVAAILSAQCTDKRVNEITPTLFSHYPTAEALAEAPLRNIEIIIRPTGLYRNKAMNLQGAARRIQEAFQGEVPRTVDQLLTLPGVGRKTAAVVLSNAFDIPAFPVDTHVNRVVNRLGLVHLKDPVKIEKALTELFPEERWGRLSHQFIQHGRTLCLARNPRCPECRLLPLCAYGRSSTAPKPPA